MRMVLSVATGPHYRANLERLLASPYLENEQVQVWEDELPPESPSHRDCPYGFKLYAIQSAVRMGATSVLWLDSSTVVLKPLDDLWRLIEQQGYWFSRNYEWNNGQFCSWEALDIMGITREWAFKIPQVTAACFGLNLHDTIAMEFLARWYSLMKLGAFAGDRGNLTGHVADPTQYQGHRNDQSCASHVVHCLSMWLTDPPEWWAEQGYEQSDKTVLTLVR